MLNPKVDEKVRKDLSQKIGIVLTVCSLMVAPALWVKDIFSNRSDVIYKNGYIVEIKDDTKKTLWKK